MKMRARDKLNFWRSQCIVSPTPSQAVPSSGASRRKRWHRADIVAAIHKKGSSLSRLGKAHGLGDCTLRTALQRPRTPSNRIIARFIGVPMHELWPDWFDRNENLIEARGRVR